MLIIWYGKLLKKLGNIWIEKSLKCACVLMKSILIIELCQEHSQLSRPCGFWIETGSLSLQL